MLSSRAHKLFMQVKSGGLIAKLEDRDRRVRRGESQSNSFYGEVNLAYVAEPSTSCGAAVRVKPKARPCEPWVMVSYMLRAAKRRQSGRKRLGLITSHLCRPFGARSLLMVRTQDSQSLALGLTLTAAPQLEEFHVSYGLKPGVNERDVTERRSLSAHRMAEPL